MSFRQKGKQALQTVLNRQQNIDIIENNIFNNSLTEDIYTSNILEIINDINQGVKLNDILNNIKNDNIGWSHPKYNQYKKIIEEQDEFIENPFEVEEGVLQCLKCKSNKVFSYTKQTRSCDEPATTFATCSKCNSKWTYSG